MDGEKEFNLDDLPLELVLLSNALPASLYFPGEEGHTFPATHDQHKKAVQDIS